MEAISGLARLHDELGWPSPERVLRPCGGGAEMYGRLAREKVGASLELRVGKEAVRVGVLVSDAASSDTDTPLALVCEFRTRVSSEDLYEAHRLAWNFCHAPVLITIDPYEVRTWSCFVAPQQLMGQFDSEAAELSQIRGDIASGASLADQAAKSLHWLSLVSGRLIQDHPAAFRPEGRADRLLLDNLKEARRKLLAGSDGLEADLAHDLIARLMFVQFLFDRKDAGGVSALNKNRLAQLHREGTLKKRHADLASILANHGDAYRLFQWLNTRFNGDFFPASPQSGADGVGWHIEMAKVRPRHLNILSDLVGGRLEVGSGQMSFWRLYSFDTIPLEFVSSIYEEFVAPPPKPGHTSGARRRALKGGVHYTPTHLVDFVLDSVLPWDGDQWDLRILDPACGSGIFLVRAFQRLVYRWRRANANKSVPPEILTEILEGKLFGVDINPHAARVASFSLYLAMCDEIDPRKYWTDVTFPSLRDRRIVTSDFFEEHGGGFDSEAAGGHYDLVIGNAPWGGQTLSNAARDWSRKYEWPAPDKDIGALFLGKALALTKQGGQVAMIQSAGTLLTNAKSANVRRRLFRTARVDEIVNFTILRFHLFPTATSPACSVTLTKLPPNGATTTYVSPKLLLTGEDTFRIVIDELDVHEVHAHEVEDPWTWTVLMGGTRRDLDLLRRLRDRGQSLCGWSASRDIEIQEGLVPGVNSPIHPDLRDRLVLYSRDFPTATWLHLDTHQLPRLGEIRAHRRTNPSVFETPQLLIKQSRRIKTGRFRAALVGGPEGVVCSQSYLSAHAITRAGTAALEAACLFINSALAVYYLSLTSGRMAYRPEMRPQDFYDLPLPPVEKVSLSSVATFSDIDAACQIAFGLGDADCVLIEDALRYAIPEIIRDRSSAGRLVTERDSNDGRDGTLRIYGRQLIRALASVLGEAAGLSLTIFEEESADERLPLRLLAVHFGSVCGGGINIQEIGSGALRDRLSSIGNLSTERHDKFVSVQRVATVFDVVTDEASGATVPSAFFVRPDQARYWSRTMALRDADRLIALGLTAGGLLAQPDEARVG